MAPAGQSSNSYSRDGQEPISFPTTLSAQLPKYATGHVTIDVEAKDAAGRMVASGHAEDHGAARPDPDGVRAPRVRGRRLRRRRGRRRHRRRHARRRARVAATGASIRARPATPPSPRARRAHARRRTATTTFLARRTRPPAATARRSASTATTRRSGTGCPATGAARRAPATAARTNMDTDCSPTCGDGVVDPDETCDTGIPRGMAGACPNRLSPRRRLRRRQAGVRQHLLGRVCPLPDRRADRQAAGRLLPTGRHQRRRQRLRGAVRQRRGRRGREVRRRHPAARRRAPARRAATDDNPCTIDYFSNIGCQPACQHFPITTAGLRRWLLPAGKQPDAGHRLPGRVRQRHPRTRRDLRPQGVMPEELPDAAARSVAATGLPARRARGRRG